MHMTGYKASSSDLNMLETLHERVNWSLQLVIYGPEPDLWPLAAQIWAINFAKIQLFTVCQKGSIKWLLGY